MAPHGFQHGPLGALRTGSGSPVFPTALDVLQLEDGVHAPMPSFPLGSPAFPPHDLIADDDHVLVTGSQLAALRDAVPSPSPSHVTASPATFEAIELALAGAPSDAHMHSPAHSDGSRTPKRSASVLPTLQIPWTPTQVQTAPVPTPPSRGPTDEVSATTLGPPADYSAGSPGVSQPIARGTRTGDVSVLMLQPALDRGDRASCPIELSSSPPDVTHEASYQTPAPTPTPPTLLTQDANARDQALLALRDHPHLDSVVFLATDVSEECLQDINLARVGYANYLLDEPLAIDAATDITNSPELIRQAADIIIGALSVGPLDTGGSETDAYRCLSPSSWFRLATAVLAGLTRGAVRTTMLRARGDFPFRPCLDSVALPKGVPEPATQSDAVRLLLNQLTNEFDVCRGASGLTEEEMTRLDQCRWPLFARELRTRMRDDTIELSERVSYFGLVDLAKAVHAEATEEELKDIIRADRRAAISGSAGFNVELRLLEINERARIEMELKASIHAAATRDLAALEQAAKEQAQSMAEAIKAEHLTALLSDYKMAAENKARNEAEAYYTDRLAKLKAQWDLRVLGDERAVIRESALRLGLFPASAPPTTPKRPRLMPLSRTASLSSPITPVKPGDKRRASTELPRDDMPPAPAPAPLSPETTPVPPDHGLPTAPIDPQTRGVASSMHNPANQMVDDPLPPFESTFPQASEDGVAPSPTPTPARPETPSDPIALIGHQLQTLANIFDARFTGVEVELARLARKVDSPPPPARPTVPPPMHTSRPTSDTAATRRPPAAPDAPTTATRPAPVRPDGPPPTGPANRQPDAPVEEISPPRVDDDVAFPPLASTSAWTRSRPRVSFAQASAAARHLTQTAAHARNAARTSAQQVQKAQGTTYTGRPRGGDTRRAPAPNTTELTVLRDGGFDDEAQETAFRNRHKADIVRELQRLFSTKLAKPPKILEGRFSRSVTNSGNFVLTLSGLFAGNVIVSFTSLIQEVFGPKSTLCPVQGFTWMQIRDVPVGDENGIATDDSLFSELIANPPFDTAWITVRPHFQVDPDSARRGRATVLFAFMDDDKKLAERTALSGLCMFGERAKVVISGSKPSLIQCGRCFALTHRSNRCSLSPKGQFKCVRCPGNHHTYHHDAYCKAKTHKQAEICDCKPKCRLCKQTGHDAVSRKCPMRGDFGAPKLVLPPDYIPQASNNDPTEPVPPPTRPGSPSALHSRVRARPAWKGKGTEYTSALAIPLPSADDLRPIAARLANDPNNEAEVNLILTDMMEMKESAGQCDDMDYNQEPPTPSDTNMPNAGLFASSSNTNPPL